MISKNEMHIHRLEAEIEELRMEKAVLGFDPHDAVAEIDRLIEDKEIQIAYLEYPPKDH